MRGSERRLKRAFDVVLAGGALAVLTPLMVVLAVLVRATSPGPAWHRAVRVGRGGHEFTLYKFRSMRIGDGARITATGDPRITPIGRFLRRSKLDELPQLVNILRGEMSLVGPRPEDPHYVAGYTPEQRRILDYVPGLTSPASVTYRDEEQMLDAGDDLDAAYAHVAADKIAIDLAYFEQATLMGDLRVIGRTVKAVLSRS